MWKNDPTTVFNFEKSFYFVTIVYINYKHTSVPNGYCHLGQQ